MPHITKTDQMIRDERTKTATLTNKTLTSPTITGATVSSPTLTSPTISGTVTNSGTGTYSGSNTFSGAVTFTGTEIQPVTVVTTSAFTLHSSIYSGKTILLTSTAGSRHKRITLPVMSAVSSGFNCRIVNAIGTLTSFGISLIPTSATQIDGTTKIFKSGSRATAGAAIEIHKVNGRIYTTGAHPGRAVASSLVWINAN